METFKELCDRCIEIAREHQGGDTPHAYREFAIAITAIEDAQMRYARGRHMQEGTFHPSDVDRWKLDGKEPKEWIEHRDRMAGKPVE